MVNYQSQSITSVIPNEYNPEELFLIQKTYNLDPLISKILNGRGFKKGEELVQFLDPKLSNLINPNTIKDFEKTINRITESISKNHKIGVFGDYDMDGIGSVSMWDLFLTKIGVNHDVIIARRDSGYGLGPSIIDKFLEKECELLIVCDVGSTDYEACSYAKQHSLDIIVIDHHQIEVPYPDAYSIINPKRSDSEFPFIEMATVGLTFYTIAALKTLLEKDGYIEKDKMPDLRKYLDIVALGTLADVAPLSSVNRIMTRYGIELIQKHTRPSINALLKCSGVRNDVLITEKLLMFKVIPKLNAPGRMGNPDTSLFLLTSDNYEKALTIAKELIDVNHERQKIQENIYVEALAQASSSLDYRWGVVVSSSEWHKGIVGIVAAKLAEHFKRPAVVISIEGNSGRGSVRSWGNINVYNALESCKEYLTSFGGHHGAAGIELTVSNIGNFAKAFDESLKLHKEDQDLTEFKVDAIVDFSEVNEKFISQIGMLGPFGNGNPEVCLYTGNLEITSIRHPKGMHLAVVLRDNLNNITHRAIGFGMAKVKVEIGDNVNIIYVPEKDTFRGGNKIQLRLIKIWKSDS